MLTLAFAGDDRYEQEQARLQEDRLHQAESAPDRSCYSQSVLAVGKLRFGCRKEAIKSEPIAQRCCCKMACSRTWKCPTKNGKRCRMAEIAGSITLPKLIRGRSCGSEYMLTFST